MKATTIALFKCLRKRALNPLRISFFVFALFVSTTSGAGPRSRVLDFNGDNKTEYAVMYHREVWSSPPTYDLIWNLTHADGTVSSSAFGVEHDVFVPADYDGDGITDFAIWHPGTPGLFYILQSSDAVVRQVELGKPGCAWIVDDYDGDGAADPAVCCSPSDPSGPVTWRYVNRLGVVVSREWGIAGDRPSPGDYDGDGLADFVVYRTSTRTFELFQTSAGVRSIYWPEPYGFTDHLVPGDYDGDGKTDLSTTDHYAYVQFRWSILYSNNGAFITRKLRFGDFPCPGDYDGNGTTDMCLYTRNSTSLPTFSVYLVPTYIHEVNIPFPHEDSISHRSNVY